jgi:hypothetical protein
MMLHPSLEPSRDPLDVWQVDTDEIGDVMDIYARHLAGVQGPDQQSRRLGLLWKKLGNTTRLARLVWEYTEMQWRQAGAADEVRERGEIRFLGRVLDALGRSPRRPDPRPHPRPAFREDDPLYDHWLDG